MESSDHVGERDLIRVTGVRDLHMRMYICIEQQEENWGKVNWVSLAELLWFSSGWQLEANEDFTASN